MKGIDMVCVRSERKREREGEGRERRKERFVEVCNGQEN